MTKDYPHNRFLQRIVKNAFESNSSVSDHPIDDEDLLLRWSHHQLSEAEHTELLDHLAQCSDCRKSVAAMIKSGVLEFCEQPEEQLYPSISVPPKNSFRSIASFLGVLMTTSLCLLLAFVFLQAPPDVQQIAKNVETKTETVNETDIPVDPRLTGVTRSTGGLAGESDRLALLIGINRYGKLPEREWLDGCHNDMVAVQSVITERFGFDPQNVTTLLDEQATAAGIRTELQRLVQQVQSRPTGTQPAKVLFHFSGHGSRVPDSAGEDGFGASLVVYDSEQQGSGTDITSAELNQFSHDICKEGKAELLLVLDACHSGGGARGITKFRGLTRGNERPAVIDPNAPRAPPRTLPEGLVFFSASQSNQKTPEYEANGKIYGLFTYHFVQLLRSEQIVSSLDYRTLKDLIHRSYLRNKIAQAPTPTVEGSARTLSRPVLRADHSIDRKPYWEVRREGTSRDTVRMEAGRIENITEHSLFELYETAEQALDPTTTSLGWFRITKVDGRFSLGSSFRWRDADHSDYVDAVLPNNFTQGFAVERYHDHGDNILAVRVVNATTGEIVVPGDPAIPETMRSALLGVASANETSWIRWTGANEPCDLVVRFDPNARLAAVFPATGSAADDRELPRTRGSVVIPEALRGGWGPVDWGTEKGKSELTDIFRRVMRVLSLRRLVAEKPVPVKTRGEAAPQQIAISIHRYDLASGNSEPVPVDTGRGIVLEGGADDWYQVRVRNHDERPVYMTILSIGPDMQIEPLAFGPESKPRQFDPDVGTNNNRDTNRLEPGGEFVSILGFEEPFGAHSLIVLATREVSDFSYLSQTGLQTIKGTRGGASQILDFIEDQFSLGTRGTRRPPVPRDDAWSIGAIEVISEPVR